MLTAAELADMRATAAEALPGTAVIHSGTFSSDGGGGGSFAYAPSGTVDCRIAPIRGDEREIGDRISPDSDHILTIPVTATITENSQVVVDGDTYNVSAIRDRSWPVTQRVELTKQT